MLKYILYIIDKLWPAIFGFFLKDIKESFKNKNFNKYGELLKNNPIVILIFIALLINSIVFFYFTSEIPSILYTPGKLPKITETIYISQINEGYGYINVSHISLKSIKEKFKEIAIKKEPDEPIEDWMKISKDKNNSIYLEGALNANFDTEVLEEKPIIKKGKFSSQQNDDEIYCLIPLERIKDFKLLKTSQQNVITHDYMWDIFLYTDQYSEIVKNWISISRILLGILLSIIIFLSFKKFQFPSFIAKNYKSKQELENKKLLEEKEEIIKNLETEKEKIVIYNDSILRLKKEIEESLERKKNDYNELKNDFDYKKYEMTLLNNKIDELENKIQNFKLQEVNSLDNLRNNESTINEQNMVINNLKKQVFELQTELEKKQKAELSEIPDFQGFIYNRNNFDRSGDWKIKGNWILIFQIMN